MLRRAVSALLVLVLLWSGVATHERSWAASSMGTGGDTTLAAVGDHTPAAGSIDHHHLDDLPAQAHPEPLADDPGLVTPSRLHEAPGRRGDAPRAVDARGAKPPYLAGPQRPPCTARLIG